MITGIVTRDCRTCGATFAQGDKPVLNCEACRREWRENGRYQRQGPIFQLRQALKNIARHSTEPTIKAMARAALTETD